MKDMETYNISIAEFNRLRQMLGLAELDGNRVPALPKTFIAGQLAGRYNELLELIEDEHFTFDGKRDLQDKGELIEEIAYDLQVSDEFNKLIKGEICWKK